MRFEKEPKDEFRQFPEAMELDETELKDKVHNCGGYWQWVVLISIIDSNITDMWHFMCHLLREDSLKLWIMQSLLAMERFRIDSIIRSLWGPFGKYLSRLHHCGHVYYWVFCWHCLLIQYQVFQTNITTGDLGKHGTGRVYADFHRNFTKCCGMKVQVRDMWTVTGLPFHNYWFCRITPETIEHKGS